MGIINLEIKYYIKVNKEEIMETLIIGHRGFNGEYVENTRESFIKALDLGVDGIELDVHLSKDGEVIVFHDFELKRMTGENGYVFQYTLAELKEMKILDKHEIPTLEEVIDDLIVYKKKSNKKLYLNVEFKAGSQMYKGIEERVMKICYERLAIEEVIFSSFDHQALVKIKELDERALTGVLTAAALVNPWDYVASIKGDYYHPNYLTLMPMVLGAMLENGLPINTYTVNDPKVGKQLIEAGIHMIITDEVEQMLQVRKECLL